MQSTSSKLYLGIDVAIARAKRLPLCACRILDDRPVPIALRTDFAAPPSGIGNSNVVNGSARRDYVEQVIEWVRAMETSARGPIERIAIDAPRNFAPEGGRQCEKALEEAGIHFIATPTRTAFDHKLKLVREHVQRGGPIARMPAANQLWMLVGFELFAALQRAGYEVIEVYPHAIMEAIQPGLPHKSKAAALQAQIGAFARRIRMPLSDVEQHLRTLGYGARHDRLDAWMCAWVASLSPENRRVYGAGPHDTIWAPK